jgi:putative transposase
MGRSRKKHVQLSLDQARKLEGRGGPRPGSGRPKGRKTVPHDKRPEFPARYPQHVTLRIVAGTESIARDFLMKKIRGAIRDSQKATFRIVEFNVLSNHLHLVVEAASQVALSRGIQGFAVRVARSVNRALKRKGKLFATRYHARALKTPREVRNVLRYVLLNRKHHASETKFGKYWWDPYSSAPWFTGWSERTPTDTDWKRELVAEAPPTVPATTWLLTAGWRRYGPLRFDEAPA